ncbi:MAG: AAA family ATPase [Syntrophobacteraceae bacterium]
MATASMITISRQLGSGGSYIGRLVANRLGYAFIDRQIIQQAARELGVEEAIVEDRDGRLQTFWEKLVEAFANGAPLGGYTPPPLNLVSDEELVDTEHRLITELAAKGPCVVLGRGAFHLLRGKGRLLNVMIHAPMRFRVERLRSIYHVKTGDEAVRMIERSDRDRLGYIRTLTDLDWFDARNYHLTIDTGQIDFATAEEIIASLAGQLPTEDEWPWVSEPKSGTGQEHGIA